jgi:hypothetical protein
MTPRAADLIRWCLPVSAVPIQAEVMSLVVWGGAGDRQTGCLAGCAFCRRPHIGIYAVKSCRGDPAALSSWGRGTLALCQRGREGASSKRGFPETQPASHSS